MSTSIFVQIAVCNGTIVALDDGGRVWTYHKAVGTTRFAFWSKLTNHRSDPAKSKSVKKDAA